MNTIQADQQLHDLRAIGVWENEGGAAHGELQDEQYGRRVEIDRTWTVYHVFTGVPARSDGWAMTGLTRLRASACMLSLNGRSDPHQRRISLPGVRLRQNG